MKRLIWIGALVVLVLWGVRSFNGLVSAEENVNNAWGKVEASYQSRADMVDGLAAIVRNAADFEQETLTQVIEARAKATAVNISVDNLTPENIAKLESAQSALSGSLSRLLATIERYPTLKASDGYLKFQDQFEGIERRILVARNDFNTTATEYNKRIRRIPTNIIASVTGFDKKPLFQAAEGSDKVPDVGGALDRSK